MAGEPTPCDSLNALKICELEKRLTLHIDYQRQAVEKASMELRERLATMNEFREQLKDQAARFITREITEPLEKRIAALENVNANTAGRFWGIGLIATVAGGCIGGGIALLLHLMK